MINMVCPKCFSSLDTGMRCRSCGHKVDFEEDLWYGAPTIKKVTTMKDMKDHDPVNNPSHYGQGKIEAIEYIEDFLTKEEYIGFLRGNIAKYLHRWPYKGQAEDLKKAQWYLNRLIERVTNED